MGIPDGIAPIKVRVTDAPVEQKVNLKDFKQWIERRGNTPKDEVDRKKIREILGIDGDRGCFAALVGPISFRKGVGEAARNAIE